MSKSALVPRGKSARILSHFQARFFDAYGAFYRFDADPARYDWRLRRAYFSARENAAHLETLLELAHGDEREVKRRLDRLFDEQIVRAGLPCDLAIAVTWWNALDGVQPYRDHVRRVLWPRRKTWPKSERAQREAV